MVDRVVFSLIGLTALILAGVFITNSVADHAREQRLIQERDDLAAESLRTFRAHEKLQQVIPADRPADKPAPGQRDA